MARLRRAGGAVVESMEQRFMLSSAIINTTLAQPATIAPMAQAQTSDSGYTPAQIRQAYGFDAISFTSSTTSATTLTPSATASIVGTGAGQTIAIVEAYRDPTIAADLRHFDRQYHLPDTSLVQVNQKGGSKLPAVDAGWAQETALDVEWAHAVAPGAKIVLVEAASDNLSDLLAAVDTARHIASVSVVSMSWGVGEFAGETTLDALFTTPSGHQPITFVAAAGDRATATRTQWPSSSPNVLSVGGSSLSLQPASGGLAAELPWSGSIGGTSTIEPSPSFQSSTNGDATGRTTPDVTYNANPETGFAVYDSTPLNGVSGWRTLGGTSAGAPQWAALIAIANQGRALTGQATLDGATGTLPTLARFYADNPSAAHAMAGGKDLTDATGMPQAGKVIAALMQGASSDAVISGPVDHDEPARPVPAEDAKVKVKYFYLAPLLNPPPRLPMNSAPLDAARADLHHLVATAASFAPAVDSTSVAASLAAPGIHAVSEFAPTVASLGESPVQYSQQAASGLAAVLRALSSLVAAGPFSGSGPHVAPGQPDVESILPLAGHPFLHIPRLNLADSLAQSLGAFINECASPAADPDEALPDPGHVRAWTVTAGVLAADAIVIGYAAHRRPGRKKRGAFVKTTYPAADLPAGAWGGMQLG
jgi:hypothetical protein